MGVKCPHCGRVTSATRPGLYRCIGCGGLFQVLDQGAIFQKALTVKIGLLQDLLQKLEAVPDEWLTEEAKMVMEELARLKEGL